MAMGVIELAILLLTVMPIFGRAIEFHDRQIKKDAKNNVSCLLVFGDSSVDPGNNNRLPMAPRSNFLPYGKDFFNGRPTGRFSNGRLATDFIAEAYGNINIIRAFLDPSIKKEDLLHGVSFASGGSGYDELTSNISHSLPLSKQLEYFRHYKIHLTQLVGKMKAENIIINALIIISMGTNDFVNYYTDPTLSKQFSLNQYQNHLISRMFRAVEAMHHLGARKLAIVGVPPFGCMPMVKALNGETKCDDKFNTVALSFNSKIKQKLATIKASLGLQTTYIDIYTVIASAIKNPKIFGFTETSKGCCGSGLIEYADGCKGMSICTDRTKYIFWDAIHPTERMYEIVAVQALKSLARSNLF